MESTAFLHHQKMEIYIYLNTSSLSTRDFEDHLRDIYGVDTSASLISRITDKIMPEMIKMAISPFGRSISYSVF